MSGTATASCSICGQCNVMARRARLLLYSSRIAQHCGAERLARRSCCCRTSAFRETTIRAAFSSAISEQWLVLAASSASSEANMPGGLLEMATCETIP